MKVDPDYDCGLADNGDFVSAGDILTQIEQISYLQG